MICYLESIGEWSDGLFTHILRKIIDNIRGELTKRQWIIFDGDVDPEWVENLNSVLDDNKLLTLPNGERLALPPNVRVVSIPFNFHHSLHSFFLSDVRSSRSTSCNLSHRFSYRYGLVQSTNRYIRYVTSILSKSYS